jgi:hypothetical protein
MRCRRCKFATGSRCDNSACVTAEFFFFRENLSARFFAAQVRSS